MFGFLATLTGATVLSSLFTQITAVPLKTSRYDERDSGCTNSPSSRNCWDGTYDIDTNWYNEGPSTGVIREYFFNVENVTISPDGFPVEVLAVNGQVPGPTIVADWGDTILVHVTNHLQNNGTTIHWHGMRQLGNNAFDGVSSITQCPIAPTETYSYRFTADSYGTTWYHAHIGLQAWDGVHGALIINGPATADYDIDMGPLVLTDWHHRSASSLALTVATTGPPPQDNGLINGTNKYDGLGNWFETKVEKGKKYRMRLINVANDAVFKFGIDGHKITVIASDLVPVTPYEADFVTIDNGQRYDIIVEANDPLGVGNYWIRNIPQVTCCNYAAANATEVIKGIFRYSGNGTYAASTADPTTTVSGYTDSCIDENANLIPWVPLTVGGENVEEDFAIALANSNGLLYWTVNDVAMHIEWNDPTLKKIADGNPSWTNTSNVVTLPEANKWIYMVIEETAAPYHPIHLHGHDFFVLASGSGSYDSSIPLNLNNPPRRDTAELPGAGYLVLAFYTDNPGVWLMHCHIGFHAAEGFAVQFVEQLDVIEAGIAAEAGNAGIQDQCQKWNNYEAAGGVKQDDSGI